MGSGGTSGQVVFIGFRRCHLLMEFSFHTMNIFIAHVFSPTEISADMCKLVFGIVWAQDHMHVHVYVIISICFFWNILVHPGPMDVPMS